MADDVQALELWPGGAPGAMGDSLEDRPRLLPFLPPSAGPRAAVIVCPGGGYAKRAPHEAEPVARWLCSLGIAGIVLHYRVKPYCHPIPLGDAQRAIRTVRARAAEWNLDPSRVGILGFSAGGHLAASAATIFDDGDPDAIDPVERFSCRPDAAVLCYAVITLDRFRHHGTLINLLGDPPDEDLRRYLSLENRVTARTCPTFLWHTSDDQAVPVENSLLLAGALRKSEVPFELHVFPHGSHGLGLAADTPAVRNWPSLCADWLARIGFAGGS